jgi:hypothetical protein
MSKGLGWIEWAILEEIEAMRARDRAGPGSVLLSSRMLSEACFGSAPSRVQHKSVVRAMHSFVRKGWGYALTGGKGRKLLYLYEPEDPISAMWAQMQVATTGDVSLSEARRRARRA